MKKLLSGCIIVMLASAGCNHLPDGADGGFPKFLAGTWKADKDLWEFTFEPDGTISSFHNNYDVQIVVEEGGGYAEVASGTNIECIIGPCQAMYTPGTGNLTVTIVTERVFLLFPTGALQGRNTDKFSGQVSRQDKTWKTKWTFTREISGTDAGSPTGVNSREIMFTKLPHKKTQKENLK